MWAGLTFGYHLASRLAYVVGVGAMLTRQERHQFFTRRDGVEAGFRRFRRIAAYVMNNDAASFVVMCVVTRQTMRPVLPTTVLLAAGALLIVVGISIKVWAAARLGHGAYYWEDFFVAGGPVAPDPPGPYRFLKNPMYTVGYLQAYGFALLVGSLPGLIAAAFDQAAILIFHHQVEKPHFDRLVRASADHVRQLDITVGHGYCTGSGTCGGADATRFNGGFPNEARHEEPGKGQASRDQGQGQGSGRETDEGHRSGS
jgi:protein-S-isoprenylcysteine O-methyltransferase Ste14